MENKMTLRFQVVNQTISRLDGNELVEGSSGFVVAKFIFSDNWNGLDKEMIVKTLGDDATNLELTNDAVELPTSVLQFPGFVFTLIGTNDNITITTETKFININHTFNLQ